MKLVIYQIDAFANRVFEGNPASVVPLDSWLENSVLQAIAEENNQAETVFYITTDNGFHIRWFTPIKEINLCGHATLAAAYVIFQFSDYADDTIEFESLSGMLKVVRENDLLTLDFPTQEPKKCQLTDDLIKGLRLNELSIKPLECLRREDYIVVLETEEQVASITPDFSYLAKLELRGVIVTSLSHEYDFIARFFAPKFGILEDSVTGSAYTQLTPYWANNTDKKQFHVKQISKRGGELDCELVSDRVLISGKAVLYLQGVIEICLD